MWEGHWRAPDLRRLRRERIGFIFQFHNLLPFLNAIDNVALAMTLDGVDSTTSRQRAGALLDYLQVGKRASAMPARLSGGEAQPVATARALVNRPKVILADEPTAALDSERARVVMDLLRQVAQEQQVRTSVSDRSARTVRSGAAARRAMSHSRFGSRASARRWPNGRGCVLPVARSRCDQRTTLTEKAFATSRILAPSRTMATTRSRRSQERVRTAVAGLQPSQQLESYQVPLIRTHEPSCAVQWT